MIDPEDFVIWGVELGIVSLDCPVEDCKYQLSIPDWDGKIKDYKGFAQEHIRSSHA